MKVAVYAPQVAIPKTKEEKLQELGRRKAQELAWVAGQRAYNREILRAFRAYETDMDKIRFNADNAAAEARSAKMTELGLEGLN